MHFAKEILLSKFVNIIMVLVTAILQYVDIIFNKLFICINVTNHMYEIKYYVTFNLNLVLSINLVKTYTIACKINIEIKKYIFHKFHPFKLVNSE